MRKAEGEVTGAMEPGTHCWLGSRQDPHIPLPVAPGTWEKKPNDRGQNTRRQGGTSELGEMLSRPVRPIGGGLNTGRAREAGVQQERGPETAEWCPSTPQHPPFSAESWMSWLKTETRGLRPRNMFEAVIHLDSEN